MPHDCYMFELTSKTVTTSEAIPTVIIIIIIIIIINIDTTNIITASIIVYTYTLFPYRRYYRCILVSRSHFPPNHCPRCCELSNRELDLWWHDHLKIDCLVSSFHPFLFLSPSFCLPSFKLKPTTWTAWSIGSDVQWCCIIPPGRNNKERGGEGRGGER